MKRQHGFDPQAVQATRPIPTRRETEWFLQRRWNGTRTQGLPIFNVNTVLSMTTRIAFMAYISSLTGIRRLPPTLAAWVCYFISGKSYANVAHSIEEARLSEQGN